MSNRGFLHFSALPMSTRMVYTMTLLVLGTGYLFAMLQVFFSHAGLDGNPKNISAEDIRIAYHGSETDTKLVSALKGPMAGMLPESERATIFKWVDTGATEEGFAQVKPIIEERCIACHDGSNPHIPLLTSQEEVKKLVTKDTGATIPTLVRVSHIHLFGITFIFFIVSSIFTHAYMRPLWMKCVIIITPFLTILTDIFSWYLTKWIPGFAWFIIGSGALMGISFAVQWIVSMWQMWFYTLPAEIEECGGTLPILGGNKASTPDN
jgi:hypothetical protein